jgi:serine/threonine protein kinase
LAHVRPESRLVAGESVQHYQVVEYVGAGGMGVVYRARDRRLGREVALKLLRGPAPGTDSCGLMCSLLIREAQVLARLSHPALVAVHDVGEYRGCVFLAMEFIDGVSLRRWAAAARRSWRERLDVLLKAGDGLVEAHAAQVIHRDVKPDNVLVTAAGRVVVTDFGLARSLADLEQPQLAACGCGDDQKPMAADTPVGTPHYMSPEQHAGTAADGRSDQFAFAATAWEMLHGTVPFPGRSLAEIRAAIEAQAPATPAGEIPAAVNDVLRRALRVSPSSRFTSMKQLLSRLAVSAA